MLTFDDLVAAIGPGSEWPALMDSSLGIRLEPKLPDGFVPPPLTSSLALGGHSVLLISAPAAVGKSTTAAAIAATLHAPVWDLATVLVGANTFVGGLLRAFGTAAYDSIATGLGSGTRQLVIDALDEAHLRSGADNLEAFVADIASVVGSVDHSTTIVLLARVETATFLELLLESHGITFEVARLGYFDEEAARRFLDIRLTNFWSKHGAAMPHRLNPGVYRRVVDAVFSFCYACFGASESEDSWDREDVRQFLGFAPVLEALADYLAVDNLQTVLAELETAESGDLTSDLAADRGPWQFLLQVIDRIVNRERLKVIESALRPMLTSRAVDLGWDSWADLYLTNEQLDRVVRRYLRVGLFSDQMPVIPQTLRDDYERALEPVADQHPFLTDARQFSNLVFHEYGFAWALSRGSPSVRDAVRAELKSGRHLPSPLLGRFLLGLEEASPTGEPTVNPEDLGVLYDSLSAAAVRTGDVLLWVVSSGESGPSGQIARADDSDSLVFALRDTQQPIEFWRRLAYAHVVFDGGVTLGLSGQTFTLGPDTVVDTDLIETPAAEYIVVGDEESYSRLAADVHVDDRDVRLNVFSGGLFEVAWEPIYYPWFAYRSAKWSVLPDLEQPFRDLVSIVKQFRKHGRDEYARKRELIDNVVVGRSDSDRTAGARSLLEFMLSRNVLVYGELYVLHLDQLGMSWTDVCEHRMTPQAESFLSEYVAETGGAST